MDANAVNNILIRFAQEGIQTPDAIEATKADILASMPEAVKESMANLSDDEKIASFMDAYFAGKKGVAEQAEPTQKKTIAPVTSSLSAEDAMSIQSYYDLNAEKMGLRASKSRVVCLLTDKPVLAAIHVNGAKLKPTIGENTEKNFDKWKDQLVDTPENKQAYAELKEAFMKGEEMEVYINPDAKEKNIGFTVETTDDNNQPVTLNMTKEDARDFLLTRVQGVIAATSENTIGISIRFIAKRNNSATDNEANAGIDGTVRVAVQNNKALKSNPDLKVCTCAILETNGQRTVNDQFNAKTAKYFSIYTGKNKSDGTPITRKVRMTGKTSVYVVERKPEYVTVFGQAVKAKGFGMTNKERAKVLENCRKAMALLTSDATKATSNAMRTARAQILQGRGTNSPMNFR